MEDNDKNSPLANFLHQLNQNIKKINEDRKPTEDTLFSVIKKFSDSNWNYQNQLDGITRIRQYHGKLKIFLLRNASATEESFINREISENAWVLERASLYDSIQEQVYYHVEKYTKFLKDKLGDLKTEQNKEKAELSGDKPLPFLLNRSQTVALMVLLMDNGIISPMRDYRLAKFIEKHFLYDNDKPMKEIANEISQFRNNTKDPEKQEVYIKSIFSKAKIKTKDDKA
jgi:hypothetical protein